VKTRTYRWDTGLRFRVLGLLLLLLSLLAVLGATLSFTFSHLEAVQQRAERTRQNVLLMEQAAGTYAEMTSALRGYVISGQEPMLQPYDSARARFDFTVQQLGTSADDPIQIARIHQVTELVHTWQTQVAQLEIAARRDGSPVAGQLITAGTGTNFIDEIRRTKDDFIQAESDRLHQEANSAAAAAQSITQVTWSGIGVAALLALFGFVVFARSVTRSTNALTKAAERIAGGDRGVAVEGVLDGELQVVAEAFTAMSMTLAAQDEELQAQQEELIAQNEELTAQQEELHARAFELERQDQRLSRLHRMGQAMIGTIEMEQLCSLILDEYLDLYGGTAGALLLADAHSEALVVQAERWLTPRWRGAHLQPAGLLHRCVERGEVVTARLPETFARMGVWDGEVPVAQETYVPLIHTGRVIAVVVVAWAERAEPSDEAQALWSGVAQQAAVALAAAVSHLEVKRTLQALQEQAAQVEELNAQLEEERDRAAAQLDIYLSIVSTMRAGAWLTDTGGNLLVVNATYREFFGDVRDGSDLEGVLSAISRQLPEGSEFPDEVRSLVRACEGEAEGTLHLNNGYVLQWSSAPVGRENDLVGRLFTFQDVTELAKLDRLKSEFVNTVSHELRTPLTSIIGYLSLVMNEQVGSLGPQQQEFLAVVRRNTDRLANLINDLLDIQRIESGRQPLQVKPVHLADLVHQVADTFQVGAREKGLRFEVEPAPAGLPAIMADPDRVIQIASNLVSNAVKYTREGFVKVSVGQGPQSVWLAVEDSGVGIPPAEQKKVFEKFFRGENRYAREAGGTGLGLALVKMMVEEHGGQVKLESQPGKGSKFTVTFPVAPVPANAG
jgi:signal transduction histidine kinase/CHASE3 domain sensor protein